MCDYEKHLIPVTRTLKNLYNTVRTCGIDAGILPRNFPTLNTLQLQSVSEKSVDFGGFGGCLGVHGNKFTKPFIVLNVHYNNTVADCMAALAHEMLHVKQAFCNQVQPSHDNAFRKDSAKFARILGITYYHVNGYDKPSLQTFKAMQAKRLQNFLSK